MANDLLGVCGLGQVKRPSLAGFVAAAGVRLADHEQVLPARETHLGDGLLVIGRPDCDGRHLSMPTLWMNAPWARTPTGIRFRRTKLFVAKAW